MWEIYCGFVLILREDFEKIYIVGGKMMGCID